MCIWSMDKKYDEFWANDSLDNVIQCKCSRCWDKTRQEPVEYEYIFNCGDPEYEQLKRLLEDWLPPDQVKQMNSGDGFSLAHDFQKYVRKEHKNLYRIVGRDPCVFEAVLSEWCCF